MNSKISKCDDKLVITLPVEVAQPFGWGVGDLLELNAESGSLSVVRTQTAHDHAMEICRQRMDKYRETLEALAKS